MASDEITINGGRRTSGQTLAVLTRSEIEIKRLNEALREAEAERKRLADQIARVQVTDDFITLEKVIRIKYTDLHEPQAVVDAVLVAMREMLKK